MWCCCKGGLRRGKGQFVFAVCGIKNSGKTTLVARLVRIFTGLGFRTATIKHDAHEFEADVPGTDTYAHRQAGAYGTAIFSPGRHMIIKDQATDETALIPMFSEADIIILEGFKHSSYPKVEIVRSAVSACPAGSAENRIALMSDLPLEFGVPVLAPDDAEGLSKLLLDYWEQGGDGE